jgi:enoyl-CoA hydratase/carnithine racemase
MARSQRARVGRSPGERAPVSARQAKKALDKATELDRLSGYAFEIEAYNRTVGTEDRQEGINAFNEKRKPSYKGR